MPAIRVLLVSAGNGGGEGGAGGKEERGSEGGRMRKGSGVGPALCHMHNLLGGYSSEVPRGSLQTSEAPVIRTYMHAYMHAYIHTNIHTCLRIAVTRANLTRMYVMCNM